MVLQPHLVAGACLALAACGKGPGPSDSTPPDGGGTTAVEAEPPPHEAPEPDEGGGSSQAPRPADEEELFVDGVRLRLQPAQCLLTAKFLDEELEHHFQPFPGACHFSPDRQGQPWVVSTDHGKAVLVESWVPAEGGDCDTALQVVVITERGPQLSRDIERVASCGPGPWDEMMIHVLASVRVPLGARPERPGSP